MENIKTPVGIDSKPVKIETAKVLIDLADKSLTRICTAGFAEVRAKLIFYQTVATLLLSAHVFVWNLLGVESVISVVTSAISSGLLCSVLFVSVLAMSGARYRVGAMSNYRAWFDSIKGAPEEQIDLYRDILKRYDEALESVVTIRKNRGEMLRLINFMLLLGIISSAVSLLML